MHKSPGSAANFPGAHWLHWWLCIWKPFSHKHTCLFHIMFGGHDSHGAPGLGRNCVNAHSSSSITCATPKFNSSKTATRHLKNPCIGCVDKFELLFRPRGFVQSSQVSSNIFIALTNTAFATFVEHEMRIHLFSGSHRELRCNSGFISSEMEKIGSFWYCVWVTEWTCHKQSMRCRHSTWRHAGVF